MRLCLNPNKVFAALLILSLLVGFVVGFIDRKQSADRQVKKYSGEIITEALMALSVAV